MPHVEQEVVVLAPADTVYQVWRNFENFPGFMSNIEEVTVSGDRSHWRAKGPLGRDAQWDAEITRDEPGRTISWRSIDSPDTNVCTQGLVSFESLGDGTRVRLVLDYDIPAGVAGEIAAKVFANPERQIEEDMQRFKENMEKGGTFMRTTDKIVGSNEDAADKEYESQVKNKYPASTGGEAGAGPGMANDPQQGRPATTGTPGGTLGAPTEKDLKENPEEPSEKESR